MIKIIRVDLGGRRIIKSHNMERIIDNPTRQTVLCRSRDCFKVIGLVKGDDFKSLENALVDQLQRFFLALT